MSRRLITLLLFIGASLQTLLPSPSWLGSHEWPVLLALILYISLRSDRLGMLYAGVLAGLLQDSFSLAPLGVSLPFFLLISLGMYAIREEVFADHVLTYAIIGPVAGLLQTVYFTIVFTATGLRPFAAGPLAIRLLAGLLLSAVTTPLVFLILESFSFKKPRRARWVAG